MNEHQQAERLASWLEANDLPPPGLDEDVVETIYALRPELAPAPRVSVDELLASLNAGPLASEPLWEPPAAPANDGAPAQLRWARYLGGGAVGTLAAAAMALLVFGNSPQPERMMEAAPAPEAVAAPAAAKTVAPQDAPQGAPAAQVAAQQAAIPEVEPTPAKDVPPTEDLVADAAPAEEGTEELKAEEALGGALADAKPAPPAEPAATTDAVVMGDGGSDDADAANTGPGAAPLTASAPTEVERRELAKQPIAEAQEEAEAAVARTGGAGAKSARADAPAPPAPAGPPAEQRDEERAKKPTPSWGAGMEEAAVAEVQAALDKAAGRARKADYRGAISTLEPFIRAPARAGMYAAARAAEYALSANDPAKAVSLCDRGLRLSAGSTPERAELTALKAKAEAKLKAAP
jgi:hypothetical protein